MPPEYGYPIGGSEKEFKHFFLEMHFDNPSLDKDVTEHTGIRLYATQEYRPIEFGILTVGSTSSFQALTIPPKSQALSIENICRKNFMNNLYKETGNITIFAELPHTHLAGREFYSKVLRNNTEIEMISDNKYYYFNYQFVNFKRKKIVLKEDDEVITTCIYNTMDRDKYTLGGLATTDEMCLNFLWYYPRNTEYTACEEQTGLDPWIGFYTNLAKKGLFEWNVMSDATFVQDTMASLEASEYLTKNTNITMEIFQQFYQSSWKDQIFIDRIF